MINWQSRVVNQCCRWPVAESTTSLHRNVKFGLARSLSRSGDDGLLSSGDSGKSRNSVPEQ